MNPTMHLRFIERVADDDPEVIDWRDVPLVEVE